MAENKQEGKVAQDAWLIREAARVTRDLRDLMTDLSLVQRKFQIEMSDRDQTIVLGKHEWKLFRERVADACREMIGNLKDFVDEDFHRQLHWSALRLLTASSVLNSELHAYREKLAYIARHPSNTSQDVNQMFNWFSARVEPLCARVSVRIVQIMARVLDPESWELSTELSDLSAQSGGRVNLNLRFQPKTNERAKIERERIKRMRRISIDDDEDE